MKKKSLFLLIALTIIFFFFLVIGLFFEKSLDIIIFSIIVFVTMFVGQKYALIKIKSAKIRFMWSFLAADLFLYLCGINLLMSFLATCLVIAIFQYAPKIGELLGFNDCFPVQDWDGTITDEGEIIGEYKYYEKNRILSPIAVLLMLYFLYFIIKYD